MSIAYDYSPCWKDLGCILVYQSDNFPYQERLIITDFENCLIDKISTANLYHSINPKTITPYNEDFVKQIYKDSKYRSIIILSNQIGSNKLNIDMIKRKLESFVEMYKIPILAFFALKPNKFSKPHTGLWKLLKSYFQIIGHTNVKSATVVSDFGGRILETTNKNGLVKTKYDNSDMDRAFAHNIGVPYNTIKEYLCNLSDLNSSNVRDKIGNKIVSEKFVWSKKYLDPAVRILYLDKISQYKNPNIYAKLAEVGEVPAYMIFVYGAPRTGKTTLSREIISNWRKSEYGKKNEIKRLDSDKYSKKRRITQVRKFLIDRISVIIDGECHSDVLRKPFIGIAEELNIPIFYVEVNPGISMSYLFNHIAVEKATNENILLYPERDFYIYQSTVKRPANSILYCPDVKQTKELMDFRY